MSSPKKWQDCQTGLIDQMLSGQQKTQDQITRRRALSAIVVGSVGCVGAIVVANSKPAADTQMTCGQVREQLQAFVDHEIADLYQRGMISRHLFVCDACQQVYLKA